MFQTLPLSAGSLEVVFILLLHNPDVPLRLDISFKLFPIGIFVAKAGM
ncbi:hypothetical protein [Candidatus Hakubella thermalkaliphila]|nr:hypothetical protein [Candidatus Hakubella thermalkaliphila]